jgi:glycosyltransferase involved in cell wall biosynthesis
MAGYPQRILLTGDTVGGVWTFVTELSASLVRQGVQVQLATFGPAVTESQRARVGSIKGLNWEHRIAKLEWMNDPWAEVDAGGAWLERLAGKFKADVVHLNTLAYGDRDLSAPIVQTAHSCVLSWWANVKKTKLPQEWNQYRDRVEASLQCAELLTAPSAAALAEIASYYKIETGNAVSIHNGVDLSEFQPLSSEPFIFSACRLWDEAKNLVALAEVAPKLRWPVYLAGSAISPTGGTTAFQSCRLLGELGRDELRTWYGRASIYVLPAKYEPFGLSVLEAALSGCALVLGDLPSLREIWGDAAIFVNPGDRNGLRREIDRLIRDRRYRNVMVKRALSRATEFSIDRMAASYLSVYNSVVKMSRRSYACAS